MIPAQLVEITRDLIQDQIKSNISVSLANVRSNRNDPQVTTEPPKSYFIFDGAHTYQCPAIFTVVDSMDLPEPQTGANFVDAVVRLFVSVVIEDREADKLTIKSERYQAALFDILHWKTLEDVPNNLKIWVRINRCEFSPLYTKKRGDEMGEFRKEVSLELEVKHWENPTTF